MTTNSEALPRVHETVELWAGESTSSRGLVQAVGPTAITLAMPSDAALADTADAGAGFHLTWSWPLGIMVRPVTLVERTGSPQMHLWELEPDGEAWFKQLRQEDRVVVGGPITLTLRAGAAEDAGGQLGAGGEESGDDVAPLSGELVDLSEGALQCVVPSEASDAMVVSGSQVACDFAPPGGRFSLLGTVLSAWTSESAPQVHVVVRFDPGQSQMDEVARYVADAETNGAVPEG